jgi:hypothetical protein
MIKRIRNFIARLFFRQADEIVMLKPKTGDVIVVRIRDMTYQEAQDCLKAIHRSCEILGLLDDFLVIAIRDDASISLLSESEMARFGWYRSMNVVPGQVLVAN